MHYLSQNEFAHSFKFSERIKIMTYYKEFTQEVINNIRKKTDMFIITPQKYHLSLYLEKTFNVKLYPIFCKEKTQKFMYDERFQKYTFIGTIRQFVENHNKIQYNESKRTFKIDK